MAAGVDPMEALVLKAVPGAPAEPALVAAHPFLAPAMGMGRAEGSEGLSSSSQGASGTGMGLELGATSVA